MPSKTELRELNKAPLLEEALRLQEQLEEAQAAASEWEKAKATLEEVEAGEAPAPDDVQELKSMVIRLTSALAGAQADLMRVKNVGEDNEAVEVQRVGGAAVSVVVTDDYGNDKKIMWDRMHAVRRLSKKQVAAVQENTTLFEDGVLSCPEMVDPGHNTISDFEEFIANLDQGDVNERINKITNRGILQGLYNHIENKRFTTVDEQGNDLRDPEEDLPIAQEVDLPPIYTLVERAVVRRLELIQGVRASTEDVG